MPLPAIKYVPPPIRTIQFRPPAPLRKIPEPRTFEDWLQLQRFDALGRPSHNMIARFARGEKCTVAAEKRARREYDFYLSQLSRQENAL